MIEKENVLSTVLDKISMKMLINSTKPASAKMREVVTSYIYRERDRENKFLRLMQIFVNKNKIILSQYLKRW